MITKGTKINDRYEIIKSIGEGGMANVYLANDVILNRLVAVKILRGNLAEDEKFIRRFQREAIAASSLNHPNIVEIYDVGEDNGKYFIVMEYVEGKTLKSLIKKRGALTLTEVIDIMLQLTSAITHAHESYIIHRDIKPQNVIIMEDGRVKIMDFGIASQLKRQELTQTNSIMGTVYYLPPEQASGLATTAKSDIYSLGILMYELVTGHVPFKGDSPVEVALKQMKDPLPSITDAYPEIPQSIENIILKACAKNPKNRYENVKDMHDDLLTALDKSRFNEPKVKYAYSEKENMDADTRSKRNQDKEEKKENKKMNKALIIISSIIAAIVFILLFVTLILPRFAKPDIKIPDVKDMSITQATDTLESKELEVKEKTKKKASDEIEEGKVIETNPGIGETVKKGTTITLIVSKGSKKITIEDYTGKNYYEVKAKLETLGLEVNTEKKDIADTENAKENIILSQDVKAGEKIKKGDTITLTIPNIYVTYPDFQKEEYTLVDVRSFCEDNGLALEIKYQASDTEKEGTIVYQNMSPGTMVKQGATVKITMIKNDETEATE